MELVKGIKIIWFWMIFLGGNKKSSDDKNIFKIFY